MPERFRFAPALAALLVLAPAAAMADDKPLTPAQLDAIKTCDQGAAVPLDPTAKAPAVWDSDLLPADLDLSKLKPLALACAEAARAAPGAARLPLQVLRIQIAIGGPETIAFGRLLRPYADAGTAEANFLMFRLYERFRRGENADRLGISRAEALAALEAAAKAGHLEALQNLFWQYSNGPLYRRGPSKALAVARRTIAQLPEVPMEGPHEKLLRAEMARAAAEIVLSGDGFTAAEQAAAFALVSSPGNGGNGYTIPYVTALRFGRGTAKDPAKARQILQQWPDDSYQAPVLAEMMANGEGGPVDGKGAIALLRRFGERYGATGQVLATLLLDGRFAGRQPQEAIRALYGSYDLDADIRLVDLLIDYHPRLEYPRGVVDKLADGAAADEPGAAMALARLKIFGDATFADIDGARALLRPLADKGDRAALALIAATQYANLDSNGTKPARREGGLSDDELKAWIADGQGRKEAAAFLLQAKLQRQGVLYPQDDEAATKNLISAANLGSVEGMVLLGEAYDEGLGTPKNPRERLHAWREAARRGSLEARERLAGAFGFDSFDHLMTLREGVTERLALFFNASSSLPGGFGISEANIALSGMFSGANPAGRNAVSQALLDGFRLAPAGLEEDKLVPTLKAFPDDIRVEMETILKQQGFFAGDPQGFWGPDARKALAAWVDAKGPLPDEAAPAAAPADPLAAGGLPAELIARVRERTTRAINAAKSKAERRTAITAIGSLARYGDTSARWALVNNYNEADYVRNVVSPEEATRYALDILLRKPEGTDKAGIAFAFNAAWMMQHGKAAAFGAAMLAAIRDTPALQDPLALGAMLHEFVFAPGACDALHDAAKKAGIAGIGGDGCDEATQTALIAFAKAKGPAGIEDAARKKAVAEILALDKAGK